MGSSNLLLCLECSGRSLSLALFKEGGLIHEIFKDPDDRGHAECLLPLIDHLLREKGLELQALTSIALTVGPGSYTSLRIGMATVLGLSANQALSIYPVSTLRTLAFGWKKAGTVVPVLKAGRGRIYASAYKRDGDLLHPILEEGIFDPKELLEKVDASCFFVGPGCGDLPDYLSHKDGGFFPRASWMGELVFQEHIPPVSPDTLKIHYLQAPDLGSHLVVRQ